MTAWLIGLLVGVAALGLGYAAVDATLGVVARARALGLGGGPAGRRRAALRAYRPPTVAERVVLPPALAATLTVLRRPAPLILLPVVGSLLLAGLARDALLAAYLTVLGVGTTLYLAYRQTLRAQQGVSDAVRRLVDAFVGLYRVNPTTFTTLALAAAHVQAGLVRDAALAAVRHYEATRDTHAALQKLLAVRDPYLVRFALVLDQAGEQGPAEIARLLADLRGRLRRRWTTRLAAQGVFAAIRGTLVVLVGAAAAVTAVGVTMPLWREIHTDSAGSRALFIGLTSSAFVAAAFFDRRMRLDEETLL
jgi:hypothetical protein